MSLIFICKKCFQWSTFCVGFRVIIDLLLGTVTHTGPLCCARCNQSLCVQMPVLIHLHDNCKCDTTCFCVEYKNMDIASLRSWWLSKCLTSVLLLSTIFLKLLSDTHWQLGGGGGGVGKKSSGKCLDQLSRTFVFSHTAPPENWVFWKQLLRCRGAKIRCVLAPSKWFI